MGRRVRHGRYRVGFRLQRDASVGRTRAPRARQRVAAPSVDPRAFVGAWGAPTYQHAEFMQFFGMKDDSLIPRSRLVSGEPPRGWEVRIEAGDALFLAYPDHGWLVVFFEERLVYREALTAAQLHELGRSWQHEDKFRSRFEVPAAP